MAVSAKKSGWIPGICMGVAISLLLAIVGALVAAWMLAGGVLEEETIGYAAMFIWLLSAFGGSLAAANAIGSKLLLVCLITGVVFCVVLLMINLGFYSRGLEGMLPTLGVVLGGSGGACLVLSRPVRQKSKHIRRRKTG